MTETQYHSFTSAACLGKLEYTYLNTGEQFLIYIIETKTNGVMKILAIPYVQYQYNHIIK